MADNRLAQLSREYSHRGTGYVPTRKEIQDAINVGTGRVPYDIAYGETPLKGGFDIGEVGGVPINATDFLPADLGANALAKLAMLGKGALASKGLSGLGLVGMVKAGEPFTFIKNTEKAPNFGSKYAQDIEPAGNYILEDTGNMAGKLPGWISGQKTFNNPLFINQGGSYGTPTNWKSVLSDKFGGKTGKALSKEITKNGYDGIVTIDGGDTSEIVDLSMFK